MARLLKSSHNIEKKLSSLEFNDSSCEISVRYWRPRIKVTKDDVISLKKLHRILEKHKNHKLRISYSDIFVYTNSSQLIEDIISWSRKGFYELWEPDNSTTKTLLQSPDIIITNTPVEYRYKITLKNQKNRDFVAWIEANQDKIKIGTRCLHALKNQFWIASLYFYVKDEKVLQLAQLTGMDISRIEELVHKTDLDK